MKIKKARLRLRVERDNNAAVAAGVETVLNAKEKEIDTWEKKQQFASRAQAQADEMREIVERHTIEIVKFKSSGWREELEAHHKRHGIKTASTEEEGRSRIVGGGPYFDVKPVGLTMSSLRGPYAGQESK
jgi:hypothetical protein